MLPITLDVLLRVHKLVLAAVTAPPSTLPSGDVVYHNWDVRHVLGELRQRVLRGVTIVFSRVIPLERPPQTHPLWQQAEHFGARCCTSMEPGVTHVVAAAGGTDKVGHGCAWLAVVLGWSSGISDGCLPVLLLGGVALPGQVVCTAPAWCMG